MSWVRQSACLEVEPTRFFPENGRPPRDATEPCRECPVRQRCLEFALSGPWEPYGVWGGLSQSDVRSLWFQRHPGVRHMPDSSDYIRRYVS